MYLDSLPEEILGGPVLAHSPRKAPMHWRTTDGRQWPVTVRQATPEELAR